MKLICVTGPDGAGKTTQIVRLAERIERGRKQKVAVVTIWDLLLDPSMRGKLAFEEPGQVDAYLGLLSPTSRTLFLYHCLFQALEMARKKQPKVCLLNAYWYKYYATEVAHGGDPETLLDLAKVFPEPDQTFFLGLGPREAFQRKGILSGYETGFAEDKTEEAFVSFQEPAHAALQKLEQEKGWVTLDASLPQADLTTAILDAIPE